MRWAHEVNESACSSERVQERRQGGRKGGEPTGVQALCDGGGVDQVALTQATCDVGVDVTEFNLPRQHVGVLQQEGKRKS